MSDNNDFINKIAQLNPSTLVNDENTNLPLQQLQSNVQFILNLLSLSTTSSPNYLSLIYGNLLDYDNLGNKVYFNGGNFDCFEKKNSFLAIDDGAVLNESEIQSSGGAADLLVYTGGVSYVDAQGEHGIWLEREFYVPPMLRGSELVFAIKGTGVNTLIDQIVPFDYDVPYCNNSTVPNISAVGLAGCLSIGTSGTSATPTSGTSGSPCVPNLSGGCYARYEDIGIDIIGSQTVVQDVVTLGPWPSHPYYAQDPSWFPEFRTASVAFRVGKNTDSIKIRIRRTRADGALAISQIFLGGLPQPYISYDMVHLDINELYDFNLGVSKFNATTVNGRHVAVDGTTSQLPNLLTKEQWLHLSQFNRNIDEFDWDQLNGPRQIELMFSPSTGAPSSIPATDCFEFDPLFTRYLHYDMRVDGPDPGMCYLGVSFFVNQNEFSNTITCAASGGDGTGVCSYIKFDVSVAVVNTTQFGNPSDLQSSTFSYLVPVPAYTLTGKMGYFEVYGDFYQNLLNTRGSIVYFTISRDGEDPSDTFEGNFCLVGAKTGIAVPPDDIPSPGTYTNLFVGDNTSC
jgi:hypothetical protein